jgi:hypothetical protein
MANELGLNSDNYSLTTTLTGEYGSNPAGVNFGGGLQKPVEPGREGFGGAGDVASTIGTRTAAGLSLGTTINAGWGTVIGGAVGLIEGIFESVFRSSASNKEYQQRLAQFDRNMRLYYRAVDADRKKAKRLEEEAMKDKTKAEFLTDRKDKIANVFRSIQNRNTARQQLASRWAS